MNTADFRSYNQHLAPDQVESVDETSAAEALDGLATNRINDCGLVWIRDEGNMGVMQATTNTDVTVTQVRNGRYSGQICIHLNAGNTLSLLQNNDGQNYDGYRCGCS